MHTSNLAFLLVAGVVFAAFGAFVYWNESRHGRRNQVRATVIGFPGVYLYVAGMLENLLVLRIVGGVLVVAGTVGQFVVAKRSGGRVLPSWRRPRTGRREPEGSAERKYDEW